MEYLCILFDHVKRLKDWTTLACHIYDSKYYKVLTIACCHVFRFCERWIMIVRSSFTLQHTPTMRSCGHSVTHHLCVERVAEYLHPPTHTLTHNFRNDEPENSTYSNTNSDYVFPHTHNISEKINLNNKLSQTTTRKPWPEQQKFNIFLLLYALAVMIWLVPHIYVVIWVPAT